jgi:hypothetical protein
MTNDEVLLIEYRPISPRSVKDGCLPIEVDNNDHKGDDVVCDVPTIGITSRDIARRALCKIQRRKSYPIAHKITHGLNYISSIDTHHYDSPRNKPCISTEHEPPNSNGRSPLVEERSSSKKWVRFHLKSTHIPTDLVLEDQDMKNLWWTHEEQRQCRAQNQEFASRFWSGRPDYRHAIEHLLYTAYCCHPVHGDDPSIPAQDVDEQHGPCYQYEQQQQQQQVLIDTITDSDMRGLEKTVMTRIHSTSMISFHRKYETVISDVLQQQVVLKHLSLDPQQRATCLAKLLSHYSVCSEQFARYLAEGDERVAKRYHEQAHCLREE